MILRVYKSVPYILSLIILLSCSYEKYEIQYNLESGKIYALEMTAEQTLKQTISGEDQVIHTKMLSGMSYHVLDIDDFNNYLIEVYFTVLYYNMESPFFNMNMDSRKVGEKQDTYSMILAELINKPFRITMNLKGEIKSVQGLDEYFQRITSQYEGLNPEEKLQLREMLKKAYGEDAFKGNMEMMTSMFPDRLIRKGGRWRSNFELRKGVSVVLDNEYKLESIRDGAYFIKNKAIARSPKLDLDSREQMRYDLEGIQQGTYKISAATGWIIKAEVSQDFKGKVIVKPGPDAPEGMEWPLQFSSNMKITGK